jgi:pyrroloquinoline quinone biosynthesis protein B
VQDQQPDNYQQEAKRENRIMTHGANCDGPIGFCSPRRFPGCRQGACGLIVLCLAILSSGIIRAESPFVVVLGIAQDGGYPQAGCRRACCQRVDQQPQLASGPACLAIVDPDSGQRWLLECTPRFPEQLARLNQIFPGNRNPGIDGILVTHAHIGHYAGLVHLGREVMGTHKVPVYAMPRLHEFLASNGPWNQLVKLENIELRPLQPRQPVALNERIQVRPLTVPHRDEYSETVGFEVAGPQHSVLFLPDIDKWERWDTAIEDVLARVDCAWLDATFYDEGELPGRDMGEIPHPFVVETMQRFQPLAASQRSKVHFIHLNHSNPALDPASDAARQVQRGGMNIARLNDRFEL